MRVEVVERHRHGVGYGESWSTNNWGEFNTLGVAYDAICKVIGKQPGFMQREEGWWEVTLADDHIFQILEVA